MSARLANSAIVYSATRLAALLLTVAVTLPLMHDQRAFMLTIGVMSVAHYFHSLIFSKSQIAQVSVDPGARWRALAFTLGGTALYFLNFPIVVFFGIHHVFNEVYVLHRIVLSGVQANLRKLRLSAIVLGFCIYFTAMRHEPGLQSFHINQQALLILLCGAYCWFFSSIFGLRRQLTRSQILHAVSGELISVPVILAGKWFPLSMFHFLFYHGWFWTLYPLPKMAQQGAGSTARYLAIILGVIGLVYLVAPGSPLPVHLSYPQFIAIFIALGFFHIASSFALSSAHPSFIRKLFVPAATRQQQSPFSVPVVLTREQVESKEPAKVG